MTFVHTKKKNFDSSQLYLNIRNNVTRNQEVHVIRRYILQKFHDTYIRFPWKYNRNKRFAVFELRLKLYSRHTITIGHTGYYMICFTQHCSSFYFFLFRTRVYMIILSIIDARGTLARSTITQSKRKREKHRVFFFLSFII